MKSTLLLQLQSVLYFTNIIKDYNAVSFSQLNRVLLRRVIKEFKVLQIGYLLLKHICSCHVPIALILTTH